MGGTVRAVQPGLTVRLRQIVGMFAGRPKATAATFWANAVLLFRDTA